MCAGNYKFCAGRCKHKQKHTSSSKSSALPSTTNFPLGHWYSFVPPPINILEDQPKCRTSIEAVSYTHLTLPTILLV